MHPIGATSVETDVSGAWAGHAARMDDERLPDTKLLSQLEHGDRIELRRPPEVAIIRNVDPITCITMCS